jgi:hypothetical protein
MSMMNVKETLKRLHKRLPTLSLDELFELLDCYVEYDSNTIDWLNYKRPSIWEPTKVWYSTDKTTSVSETPKISCITNNTDPGIYTIANCTDGKIKFYDGGGSTQLVAEH